MAYSKTFQRRVGPGSTPPALGSDGVPSGAASLGASNAFSTVARSNGIAVNRIAVTIAGAAGAAIGVEVYQYDEPTQTWTLLDTQLVTVGRLVRYDAVNNQSDTSLVFYIRPLVTVVPNGTYTFLIAPDTSQTISSPGVAPPAAGLATEATLVTRASEATAVANNVSLTSIDSKTPALVGGRQPVDGSGVTQPVSAVALPLPAGAATEVTLANIDGKLPTLGPKTAAGSVSIARPLSSQTPAGAPTPASSGTIKGSAGRLSKVRVGKRAAGTHYFQLHDAVNVAGISNATMRGAGRELQGNGDEIVIDFSSVPEEYAAGITWAMSSTRDTYTAAATNVVVEAQWE